MSGYDEGTGSLPSRVLEWERLDVEKLWLNSREDMARMVERYLDDPKIRESLERADRSALAYFHAEIRVYGEAELTREEREHGVDGEFLFLAGDADFAGACRSSSWEEDPEESYLQRVETATLRLPFPVSGRSLKDAGARDKIFRRYLFSAFAALYGMALRIGNEELLLRLGDIRWQEFSRLLQEAERSYQDLLNRETEDEDLPDDGEETGEEEAEEDEEYEEDEDEDADEEEDEENGGQDLFEELCLEIEAAMESVQRAERMSGHGECLVQLGALTGLLNFYLAASGADETEIVRTFGPEYDMHRLEKMIGRHVRALER